MVYYHCVRMCTNDSTGIISMTKPVKKGFLNRYKKRLFGSNWRKTWVVLHEDSSFEWYKNEDEDDVEGAVILKEAPEMIAAGPFASYVPGKPEIPKDKDMNCLMAFSNKTKENIYWFLAANLDDLNQWMTAISNTLPPPPQQSGGENNRIPGGKENNLPPPYAPTPSAPQLQQQTNGAQQHRAAPQTQVGGYGRAGNGGDFRGGGGGEGRFGGYGNGGQNTVIIDRRDDGIGNFASGMMMGAALTGWGSGYGWGIGPSINIGFGGWGTGFGFGGPRFGYNDTDINVTNNYNTTNSTVNNTTTEENRNTEAAAGNEASSTAAEHGDSGVDPGLDEGVDPNGFEPGFEPDAEALGDSGLQDGNGMDMDRLEMDGDGYDMGGMGMDSFDMGGYDMGGFDMGGMDYDY